MGGGLEAQAGAPPAALNGYDFDQAELLELALVQALPPACNDGAPA